MSWLISRMLYLVRNNYFMSNIFHIKKYTGEFAGKSTDPKNFMSHNFDVKKYSGKLAGKSTACILQ